MEISVSHNRQTRPDSARTAILAFSIAVLSRQVGGHNSLKKDAGRWDSYHSNKTGQRQKPPEAHSLVSRTAPTRTDQTALHSRRRVATNCEYIQQYTVNYPPKRSPPSPLSGTFRALLVPSRPFSRPRRQKRLPASGTPATFPAFSCRTGNIAPIPSTTASRTDSASPPPGRPQKHQALDAGVEVTHRANYR